MALYSARILSWLCLIATFFVAVPSYAESGPRSFLDGRRWRDGGFASGKLIEHGPNGVTERDGMFMVQYGTQKFVPRLVGASVVLGQIMLGAAAFTGGGLACLSPDIFFIPIPDIPRVGASIGSFLLAGASLIYGVPMVYHRFLDGGFGARRVYFEDKAGRVTFLATAGFQDGSRLESFLFSKSPRLGRSSDLGEIVPIDRLEVTVEKNGELRVEAGGRDLGEWRALTAKEWETARCLPSFGRLAKLHGD